MRPVRWIQSRSPRVKRLSFYLGGVVVLIVLTTPPLRILFDALPGTVGEHGLAYVKGQSEGVWGAWAIAAYFDFVLRWFRSDTSEARIGVWWRRAIYLAVTIGWMLFITWTPWKNFLYDIFGVEGIDVWQFFRTGYEGILAGALLILVVDLAIFGLREPKLAQHPPATLDAGAVTAPGLGRNQLFSYALLAAVFVVVGVNWSSPTGAVFGDSASDLFFYFRRLSESPLAAFAVAIYLDAMLGRSDRAARRFAEQGTPRRWAAWATVVLMVLLSLGATSTAIGDALGGFLSASQVEAVQTFLFIQYETWCLVALVAVYVAYVWARPVMGRSTVSGSS